MADSTDPVDQEPLFLDLVLYPHRSLSPAGFLALMAAIVGLSFAIGLTFFLIGAWPVVGFLGLDIAVVYAAFRLNFRAARAYETIRLTREQIEVVKVDPRGRGRRFVLPCAWAAVDHDVARHRPISRLKLRSHGKWLEVGAFLSPAEKDGLAEALREGLRRATLPPHLLDRHPT